MVSPLIFLVRDEPPTPPTLAAAQHSPSVWSFLRAMIGREPQNLPMYMTIRERFDFAVLAFVFGVLVAAYVIATMTLHGLNDDVRMRQNHRVLNSQ